MATIWSRFRIVNFDEYCQRFKPSGWIFWKPAKEAKGTDYTYDNLSRLLEADYDSGSTVYNYGYDLAGNLVNNNGTTRTFNSANQMTNDGTNTLTYDNNGNLTSDGTNTHTWDRANRLLSVGNHSYAYDGNGARIQKTVSSVVTDYLLDVQPGLTQVLREDDGTNTNHYIHSPRGIHAMNDGANWSYMLQDGLGSVRAEIAQNVAVNGSQSYAPYGEVFGVSGSMSSPYGFSGEQTDGNGQVYLRARYYNPSIGVFNALDPFEGSVGRPMSLNGYSWVEGNPVMNVDPSGLCSEGDTQCYQDANYLTLFGFFPLWDENPLDRIPESLCSQATQVLSLTSTGKLKWSADEMRSLRNGVNILYRANQNIDNFKGSYQFPTNAISLVKVDTLTDVPPPTPTPQPNTTPTPQDPPLQVAGRAISASRIIQLSQDVWSTLNEQERSWLFIHEFGHILVKDFGTNETELGVRLQTETDFYARGHYPTRYAYRGGPNEFVIEVLTGVIWNHGYSTVEGYTSNAGGRTGWLDLESHRNNVQSFPGRTQDNRTFQASIVNVDLNLIGGQTLSDWIIQQLFNGE